MKIRRHFFSAALIITMTLPIAWGKTGEASDETSSVKKIYARSDLIQAGDRLMDQGMFDEALVQYLKATEPIYLNYPRDKGLPLARIRSVLKFQHKYEEALKNLQWVIDINPKGDGWVPQQRELKALLEAQKTGNTTKLYEHIRYLREKNQKWLPPKGYHTSTAGVASVIIQIYDTIGDQDGGIAFCDEMLQYWEKKSGQDLHKPGNKNQYFLIRQAFEQDKKEGFKGCLDAKPGDTCMGRATKTLIESDYFPW